MDTLRSVWSIEFATIICDATTELHDDFDVDMFFAYILIYGSIIFGLVWIAVFIAGLRSTKTKDATENTNKDPIENTNKDPTKSTNEDPTENTKDLIENTEGDEPMLPSLPTGAVSADTAPPALVSEPTGSHTTIKQLRDIRSLLAKLELKVEELESLLAEESSTSSANNTTNDDSTTDDSTTDDNASNERPTVFADRGYSRHYNDREETNKNNERIEREPPNMAQAKANAYLWQQNQVAKMKRQNRQRRQQKKGY